MHVDPVTRPFSAPGAPVAGPRQVQRAIRDARAGVPVVILGESPLLVLPAETASEAALARFGADAVLVLAPTRAAFVLGQAVAAGPVALRPASLTPAALLALADPTRGSDAAGFAVVAAPARAAAALQLAKHAHLLPAMLVMPAPDGDVATVRVAAADVLAYAQTADASLLRVAEASVPVADAGDARLVAFRPADGGVEHLALLVGRPEQAEAPLVRVHSECFTGDVLGSLRCDCGPQLHQAIRRMSAEGAGVLLYMAQEGRGIGLVNKLRAYALQDRGLDTLDANRALGWGADERSFLPAATMLKLLGITRIRLLTNNPQKLASLAEHGIEVAGRVSHAIAANGVNDAYLATKARRFGHLLE
jgi:GTP cyclohydrolase II